MKKCMGAIMFFLVVSVLTGCGKKNLGDGYVEGSDFQYMYLDEWNRMNQQKGENGFYFVQGYYVYSLDSATQKLIPLCNKADCLHDRETDEKRYADCNAYTNMSQDFGDKISYCNGYLYYIGTESDPDDYHDYSVLYRLKEDGSQKDKIYQWDKDIVSDWCIHRDVLYYVEHTFEAGDNGGEDAGTGENYVVKKLSLKRGRNQKPEIIYEPEKGLSVYTVSWFMAYGNHLYFMIHASTAENPDEITDDNWTDYIYFKYWNYDILTKELTELTLPNLKKGEEISSIGFWKNKLIIQPYDNNRKPDGKVNVYLAELDGSGAEILFEDVKQGMGFFSDGKYLYASNSILVEREMEDKQYYQVYDENLKLLDTLGMPFEMAGNIVIGQPEGTYFFLGSDDADEAYLGYFDKGTIGDCNGEAFPVEKIADFQFSAAQKALGEEQP